MDLLLSAPLSFCLVGLVVMFLPQRLMSRAARASCDGVKEPVKVSIPRYVLRGQGKDEHFEFEVKVSPPNGAVSNTSI